jgi:hypothetical protein
MPIILATWEAEIGRIVVMLTWSNSSRDPISKIITAKWTRGVAQLVKCLLCECLLCKCKALSSDSSPTTHTHTHTHTHTQSTVVLLKPQVVYFHNIRVIIAINQQRGIITPEFKQRRGLGRIAQLVVSLPSKHKFSRFKSSTTKKKKKKKVDN